ncbi:hypothetical protein PHYSODRAFT_326350 [Phytophthora sojae]|uniref:Uncharacterized protein n=1 Tax=Phytophthora sojae (strain P6497) TaxID=1094619 RepID=G4Z1G7_PHYSP|nr:hypothetical protein PHYSODRAFT_326350 [Phytophthora sojae]EGZ25315.1 hypothetical protein PHYSODRAFT_326350 [Phytophthora sojae]|eukprot:XP_009520603.1 hypothetical protein PHYSODRAFT_326350 [Phytophthora sojae]
MSTIQDSFSTHTPDYMVATDSDASSGDDSELLISLFEQPEPASPVMTDECDRGGRAFPYTRSKTRWRKRPNDELKYLRAQVAELQCVLAALNQSGRRPTATGVKLQKLCEANQSPKVYAALVENRKLRAMVARQLQVVKLLQSSIDEDVRMKAQKLPWPSSVDSPTDLMGAMLNEEQQYPCFGGI